MISYRRAVSTACYFGAIVCFTSGASLLWTFAPQVFGVTILFVGAVLFIALAAKFDDRL